MCICLLRDLAEETEGQIHTRQPSARTTVESKPRILKSTWALQKCQSRVRCLRKGDVKTHTWSEQMSRAAPQETLYIGVFLDLQMSEPELQGGASVGDLKPRSKV